MRRLLLFVILAGCGSTSLKQAGESCVASSECDPGLLCDFGTHSCAGMSTLHEGQRVSYDVVVTERGKQAAGNLQNA